MSFSQPVKQTVQKIKGLGLKPGVFDLFFVLSTRLKFRVSGYSQDDDGRLLYPVSRGYIFPVWVKCLAALFAQHLTLGKC